MIVQSIVWTVVVAGLAIAALQFFARRTLFGGKRYTSFGWLAAAFVVVIFRTVFTSYHQHGRLLFRSYTAGDEVWLWVALVILIVAYWAEQFAVLPERSRAWIVLAARWELFFAALVPFSWVHGLWYLVLMVLLLLFAVEGFRRSTALEGKVLNGLVAVYAGISLIVILLTPYFWHGYAHDVAAFKRAFVSSTSQSSSDAPPKSKGSSGGGQVDTTSKSGDAGSAGVASGSFKKVDVRNLCGSTSDAIRYCNDPGITTTHLVFDAFCHEQSDCTSQDGRNQIGRSAQSIANLSHEKVTFQAVSHDGKTLYYTVVKTPTTKQAAGAWQQGRHLYFCDRNGVYGLTENGQQNGACVTGA